MKPHRSCPRGEFFLARHRGHTPNAHAAFRAFYRQRGAQRIGERVRPYQTKLGVQPKSVRVLELKHRLGSCTPQGTLNFHWKCMMALLSVLDYIVVHELAHLLHPNHTAAFWNDGDKVLPDYRERNAGLRVNGAGMDL